MLMASYSSNVSAHDVFGIFTMAAAGVRWRRRSKHEQPVASGMTPQRIPSPAPADLTVTRS